MYGSAIRTDNFMDLNWKIIKIYIPCNLYISYSHLFIVMSSFGNYLLHINDLFFKHFYKER